MKKFSLSRRGFLKAMPAAPLAVRQAQAKAEKLVEASISAEDWSEHSLGRGYNGDGLTGRAFVKMLRFLGLPDWKKDQIHRQARESRRLDPDIASLQSVSLSGKLELQWRRNEKREYRRLYERPIESEDRDEFLKKHNLEWF